MSVGNVAQLCTDLLIATHRMERIGFLHHSALLPLVGNNAYAHLSDRGRGCLHTSCEGECIHLMLCYAVLCCVLLDQHLVASA